MNRYKCPHCGIEFKELAKASVKEFPCPICGNTSKKIMPRGVASVIQDKTRWKKTSLPGSYEPSYSRTESTWGKNPKEV